MKHYSDRAKLYAKVHKCSLAVAEEAEEDLRLQEFCDFYGHSYARYKLTGKFN